MAKTYDAGSIEITLEGKLQTFPIYSIEYSLDGITYSKGPKTMKNKISREFVQRYCQEGLGDPDMNYNATTSADGTIEVVLCKMARTVVRIPEGTKITDGLVALEGAIAAFRAKVKKVSGK